MEKWEAMILAQEGTADDLVVIDADTPLKNSKISRSGQKLPNNRSPFESQERGDYSGD